MFQLIAFMGFENYDFLIDLCAVEPDWLSVLSPHLCSYSKPLEQPPPDYDTQTGTVKCYMTSTFGK